MAANPADLATVADLIAWMGLENVDQATTDQLQRLVTATSIWIQEEISRTIRSLSYTETLDGHGGDRIMLCNYPVTAVASVSVDGQALPPSSGPGQPGFALANDLIVLRGYRFALGAANVVVVYTAGFATIPQDLTQACLELASLRWKERDRIGHVSKSLGGETVTFMVKAMPDSVRQMLGHYRRVV